MHVIIKAELAGEHVHAHMFIAPSKSQTPAHNGKLVMSIGEWQLFGAALLMAADKMHGQMTVEIRGFLAEVQA